MSFERIVYLGSGKCWNALDFAGGRSKRIHYFVDDGSEILTAFKERFPKYSEHSSDPLMRGSVEFQYSPSHKLVFVPADARATNLVSGSASKVYITDLFSYGSPADEQCHAILQEAARLVSKRGRIFIGESITPHGFTLRRLIKMHAESDDPGVRSLKLKVLVSDTRREGDDSRPVLTGQQLALLRRHLASASEPWMLAHKFFLASLAKPT